MSARRIIPVVHERTVESLFMCTNIYNCACFSML
jgi:hypothetical protein